MTTLHLSDIWFRGKMNLRRPTKMDEKYSPQTVLHQAALSSQYQMDQSPLHLTVPHQTTDIGKHSLLELCCNQT